MFLFDEKRVLENIYAALTDCPIMAVHPFRRVFPLFAGEIRS